MNNFFFSKQIKIMFAIFIAAMIAVVSSVMTYIFVRQELPEETQEPAVFENTVFENTETVKTDTFAEMTGKLKNQARAINGMNTWVEKRAAIDEIGEELKELFSSDYAEQITNDTFNTKELSVVFTTYTLSDGQFLRKITYTAIFEYSDRSQTKESFYFLQYSGETAFFSDTRNSSYYDEECLVFENTEGCFAFLLSETHNYTNFNTNRMISNCNVTIYAPRDGVFTVAEYVQFPMKVMAEEELKLIQEDNTIKAVMSNYWNPPECVFNSDKLTFERQKGKSESESIDYDMPGLLLGLSDSDGNIRTLFIREENDKIYTDEYPNQIIFSRQDKLFSLEHYILEEEYKNYHEDKSGDEVEYRTGALGVKKLLCAPLGIDITESAGSIFADKPSSGYYDISDIPLYVGENYVCYVQTEYISGGGTWHESASRIRFDRLDDLTRFSFSDSEDTYFGKMEPEFEETTLTGLVYGKKAEDLFQSELSTYGGNLHPYVDFKQLSLKRNLGKWSIMLPVMEEYFHPGNGSYGNWIKAFTVYSNEVPPFLASKGDISGLDSWNNWDAKDFLGFPDSDAMLYHFDYFIGIRSLNNDAWGIEGCDIAIPVDLDECIVSISFADSDTQRMWMDELGRLG